MKKLLVLNGPNINFVGIREKGIYGSDNYETLVKMINDKAESLGVEVEVFQSNHEGAIIDKIQQAYYDKVDGPWLECFCDRMCESIKEAVEYVVEFHLN